MLIVYTQNATTSPNGIAIPLLRAYAGAPYYDHFYTTDAAEMQRAVTGSYREEGHAGLVYAFQAPGTVPFYRTYSPTLYNHFYTTALWERNTAINNLGYKDEGIVAYIYPTEMCGSVPFHRLFIGAQSDDFYTADVKEVASVAGGGYKYEVIAGYILPN